MVKVEHKFFMQSQSQLNLRYKVNDWSTFGACYCIYEGSNQKKAGELIHQLLLFSLKKLIIFHNITSLF